MSKKNLRTRFAETKQQLRDIYAAAKAENRGLTDAESANVENLRMEMNEINTELAIESAERAAARVYGAGGSEERANEVRSLFAQAVRMLATALKTIQFRCVLQRLLTKPMLSHLWH